MAPTIRSVLLVDEQPRGAGRVAAVEGAAGVGRGADLEDVDVEARLARGLLGVADGGDLRVGEDDARGRRAVGAVLGRGRVAEEVLGGDARLVLAHVGEQDAAVDVADRVEPVVAGDLHVVVDLDVAAGLEPDGLEAEVLGARLAPERGDEHARRRRSSRRPP